MDKDTTVQEFESATIEIHTRGFGKQASGCSMLQGVACCSKDVRHFNDCDLVEFSPECRACATGPMIHDTGVVFAFGLRSEDMRYATDSSGTGSGSLCHAPLFRGKAVMWLQTFLHQSNRRRERTRIIFELSLPLSNNLLYCHCFISYIHKNCIK